MCEGRAVCVCEGCVCVGGGAGELCVWGEGVLCVCVCVTYCQSMDFVLERLKSFLRLSLRHLSIDVMSQLILCVCVCVGV